MAKFVLTLIFKNNFFTVSKTHQLNAIFAIVETNHYVCTALADIKSLELSKGILTEGKGISTIDLLVLSA
jgi:hypothetical protein